jgi:hypothetical protein
MGENSATTDIDAAVDSISEDLGHDSVDGPIECVFCGDEYDPQSSDAERPDDYCSADHQRAASA